MSTAASSTSAPATAQYASALSQVPFLSGAPHEELCALAERSVIRHCAPGQPIVNQGDFGHCMFVVLHGCINLHAEDEQGMRYYVGRLEQQGTFFGEEALLGRGVRPLTAISETPTTLIEIERNRFDLLARRYEQARHRLEAAYHYRAITTYVRLHRYLSQLDERTLHELVAGATMRKLGRNELACQTGESADMVMLIKDGVLKMARNGRDGRQSILAYFNTHDVAGVHDGATRDYDLIALGQAEVIYIPRLVFAQLEHRHPQVYARFGKDDMRRQGVMRSVGQTIIGSAQAFLSAGVEVESLLVINLDRCVRCGNCVRACHARHQFTRLDRRGPIFRRRAAVTSSQHEHILIPSSCRHCRDPECMIGCPTGAIQRFPNGDVDINDNCIGCDNCARKCPYGNITMRPLAPEEQREGVTKRAIKCNLCRGHSYSNCVHECPRGAVLRVDPLRYFDELALIMEPEQIEAIREQNANAPDSHKQRIRPRSTRFIALSLGVLALGLIAIIAAYLLSPAPRSGRTPLGLGLGITSAVCLAAALALGARKRLRTQPVGSYEIWVQFHMIIGVLGFVAALAHAGFAITGVFTTLLLVIFAIEIMTGVLGQAIYMVVPRMLTRLERKGLSRLVEDVVAEESELTCSLDELIATAPDAVQALVRNRLQRLSGSLWSRLRANYDSDQQIALARRILGSDPAAMEHVSRLERIIEQAVRLADVRAQYCLHRSMRLWLIAHLATSAALAVLVTAHVAGMLLVLV